MELSYNLEREACLLFLPSKLGIYFEVDNWTNVLDIC